MIVSFSYKMILFKKEKMINNPIICYNWFWVVLVHLSVLQLKNFSRSQFSSVIQLVFVRFFSRWEQPLLFAYEHLARCVMLQVFLTIYLPLISSVLFFLQPIVVSILNCFLSFLVWYFLYLILIPVLNLPWLYFRVFLPF